MADKSNENPPKSADEGPSPTEKVVDPTATRAGAQDDVPLTINGQYIKDLSFEAPTTPGIFALIQQEPPNININVDVKAQGMQNNVFEVVLVIKAECKTGDSVAFILELSYGGVFTLNVPQDDLETVLLVECPRLLFPFARNIVAEATRDGGFPPVMIGPVDFMAMFQNQQSQEGAWAEPVAAG
jgi:preprotein translocase subunit SecB